MINYLKKFQNFSFTITLVLVSLYEFNTTRVKFILLGKTRVKFNIGNDTMSISISIDSMRHPRSVLESSMK